MFSINIYLRFALIGVTLVGGIILSILVNFWYALPFLIVGLFLLVGYIFLGTVQSSAALLQSGDLEATEKRLSLTFNPKWLYATNRAYYYMLKGSIALGRKEMEEGEKYLKMAQEIEIPTDNEKAILEIQLANINASKGKWKQAQIHFRNAKQLNVSETMIKDQIKQFEKVLQNRGQMKAAGRMGGNKGAGVMRAGGKRRRPRMK